VTFSCLRRNVKSARRDSARIARIPRRTRWWNAGFIAGATVGAIIGAQLSGQAALAGVPGAIYILSGALAAYPASRLMERGGRRVGLALGFTISMVGAILAGVAVLAHSFFGFIVGFAIMGGGRGFTDLSRYAAADMYPLGERARAISLVVLGGTVGAITGPALVAPMGRFAELFRGDPLAGPWFASAALFLLGSLLISLFLRPDPQTVGRALVAQANLTTLQNIAEARPWREILRQPPTQVAITAMVIGQLVMIMLMAITSLHMTHHGHALGDVSIVIMAHTLGMFGLSVISGRLADNFGRTTVIMLGSGLLILACLIAPLSQSTGLIALALFLLGLGWNFCYVAGAALLTDTLTPTERGRVQGSNDLLVGMVSAFGNLGSGVIFATLGYTLMSWLSLAVALIPLGLTFNHVVSRSHLQTVESR
jgi:MFS family permease